MIFIASPSMISLFGQKRHSSEESEQSWRPSHVWSSAIYFVLLPGGGGVLDAANIKTELKQKLLREIGTKMLPKG